MASISIGNHRKYFPKIRVPLGKLGTPFPVNVFFPGPGQVIGSACNFKDFQVNICSVVYDKSKFR